MNEQPIDAEAIINDLLEQLKQATLQLAILRSVLRRYEREDEE